MADLKNLADILSDNAGILEKELATMGIKEYSFENPHLPMDFPVLSGVGSDARATVISVAEKILSMAQGPLFCLNKYIQTVCFRVTLLDGDKVLTCFRPPVV